MHRHFMTRTELMGGTDHGLFMRLVSFRSLKPRRLFIALTPRETEQPSIQIGDFNRSVLLIQQTETER